MPNAECRMLVAALACWLGLSARAAEYRIVIDLGAKTVTATNTMSVREQVPVRIVNLGGSAASSLDMRLMNRTGGVVAICNTWTGSGSNECTGTLDLNTVPLVADFSNKTALSVNSYAAAVWDQVAGVLLANDVLVVQNNPYNPTSVPPASITNLLAFLPVGYTNEIFGIGAGATNLALSIGAGGTSLAYAVGAGASNLALGVGAGASNLAFGVGAGATSLTLAAWATASNAQSAAGGASNLAWAIGAGATNLSLAVGAGATGFARSVGAGATNLAYAIGAGATSLTLAAWATASNALGLGGSSSNLAWAIGAGATNLAYAIGAGATNLAYAIGAGATNYGLTIGAGATSEARRVGLGATNLALAVGLGATNYALTIGAGASNLAYAIGAGASNLAGSSITGAYVSGVSGTTGSVTKSGHQLVFVMPDVASVSNLAMNLAGSGSNLAWAIGAGATSLAYSVGAGATNYGLTIGAGATNVARAVGAGATSMTLAAWATASNALATATSKAPASTAGYLPAVFAPSNSISSVDGNGNSVNYTWHRVGLYGYNRSYAVLGLYAVTADQSVGSDPPDGLDLWAYDTTNDPFSARASARISFGLHSATSAPFHGHIYTRARGTNNYAADMVFDVVNPATSNTQQRMRLTTEGNVVVSNSVFAGGFSGNGNALTNLDLSAYAGTGLAWNGSALVVTQAAGGGGSGTFTNLNLGGSNFAVAATLNAGSNVSLRMTATGGYFDVTGLATEANASSRLASNTWAAADSTTNYVRRAGDRMTGTLTNDVAFQGRDATGSAAGYNLTVRAGHASAVSGTWDGGDLLLYGGNADGGGGAKGGTIKLQAGVGAEPGFSGDTSFSAVELRDQDGTVRLRIVDTLSGVKVNEAYWLPSADGAASSVMMTDGAGVLAFSRDASGLTNLPISADGATVTQTATGTHISVSGGGATSPTNVFMPFWLGPVKNATNANMGGVRGYLDTDTATNDIAPYFFVTTTSNTVQDGYAKAMIRWPVSQATSVECRVWHQGRTNFPLSVRFSNGTNVSETVLQPAGTVGALVAVQIPTAGTMLTNLIADQMVQIRVLAAHAATNAANAEGRGIVEGLWIRR